MDEFDETRRKDRMVERHLRGAKRFEERRENLRLRKQRGAPPPGKGRRVEGEEDEWSADDAWDDGGWDEAPPRRIAPRVPRKPQHATGGETSRVSAVARTEIQVMSRTGATRTAKLTPRVLAEGGVVVGDDVVVDASDRVVERTPRRSILERKDPANRRQTKVLAANVDVGLIVLTPRSDGLSLGFVDRAVAALREGGVEPWIVVTHLDEVPDGEPRDALRNALAPWVSEGIPADLVSSTTGEGLAPVREGLRGRVAVTLGHSGVGKSTLVNALDPNVGVAGIEEGAGLVMGEVRSYDGKGRHTTTASQLVPFLDGGALVDTPGVRLLVPTAEDVDALVAAVPELARFLGQCRFTDCTHGAEPGCAILAAAEEDEDVAAALRRFQRLLATARKK